MRRPPERQAKVTLRIPVGLHRRIVQLAEAERRSLNNLILKVLERYVQERDQTR